MAIEKHLSISTLARERRRPGALQVAFWLATAVSAACLAAFWLSALNPGAGRFIADLLGEHAAGVMYTGFFLGLAAMMGLAVVMYPAHRGNGDALPLEIRSGIEGEARVLALLRRLPDSCALFNQLHVPNPRSRTGFTELDLVVVAPSGIHIIEVKNHRGLIEGGAEQAREWALVRRDRGRELMRNPVRQAHVQARVLGAYLRQCGIRVPVHPLVVLSNPESSWRPGGRYSIPVIQLRNQAPEELLAHRSGPADSIDEHWSQAVEALARLRFTANQADRLAG